MIVIAKLSESTDICSSILNGLSCMEADLKGSFFLENSYNSSAAFIYIKYGLVKLVSL